MIDITQGHTRPTESHQARLELCHLPRERSLATLAELAVLSLSRHSRHTSPGPLCPGGGGDGNVFFPQNDKEPLTRLWHQVHSC